MQPCSVRADITLNLHNVRSSIKREWESLRNHDIGFLLTIRPPPEGTLFPDTASIQEKYGVVAIRGCEIEGLLDAKGQVIEERSPNERPVYPLGDSRTYRVHLDTNQYYSDTLNNQLGVYDTVNIFLRRNPKENNFKAVLDTIRSLMNTHCVVPDWLHDIFLG